MKTKRILALVLALVMALSLWGCGEKAPADDAADTPTAETVTDMIGREVEVTPGSYKRVVCIGAGALRLYSYVGDVGLLCGVEDIDNTTLSERPKMFDGVARPYVIAYGDTFAALPSCGVGGPNAQAAEAEKILSCTPDLIISQYEDVEKADALQQQVGVPVITLRTGVDGVFSENFSASITLLGKELDLRKERYISGSRISRLAEEAGAPDIERKVLFLQELLNTTRSFAPSLFDGNEGRMKVLDAVQDAVDAAIAEEDAWLAEQG